MKYNNKKSDTTISNVPNSSKSRPKLWQWAIRLLSVLPGLNLATNELEDTAAAKRWAEHKSPLVTPLVAPVVPLVAIGGAGRMASGVKRLTSAYNEGVRDASSVLFNRFSIGKIGYSISSNESMLYILYFIILFMIVFLKNNIFIENMGLTIPIMFIIGLIFIGYGCMRRWVDGRTNSKRINLFIKWVSTIATIVLSIVFFCLSLEDTWIFKKVECVIKNFVHIIKNILYSMPYHTIISLIIVIILSIKFPKYALVWIIGFFIFMAVSLKVFLFVIIPLMLIVIYGLRLVYMFATRKDSTDQDNKFDFILNVLEWISSCFMDITALKNKYNELEKNKIGKTTKLLLLFEIVVILLIIVCPIILNHLRKHGGKLLLRDNEDRLSRGPQNLNKQTTIVYSGIRNDVKNTIDIALESHIDKVSVWDISKVSMFDSATDKSRTYNFALSMWIYINKFDKSTNKAYAYNFDNNSGVIILNYLKRIKIKYNNQTDNLEIYNGNRKIHQTTDYKFQKWNNIVLNYSNGTLDVFINDKLVISKSNIRFSDNNLADKEVVIGTGPEYNLIGGVKDVYYYNTNISRNMIHLIYYL